MRRDDDDDDDDDDRPRRKKRFAASSRPRRGRAAAKTASPAGLIIGLVAVGVVLLVLGGVGIAVYRATRKPPAVVNVPVVGGGVPGVGPVGQKTGNSTFWVNYTQADGLYSVKVPVTQLVVGNEVSKLQPFGSDQISQMSSLSQELTCHVTVLVMSPDSLAREQRALQQLRPNQRQVNWLGRVAVEESEQVGPFPKMKRKFIDGNKLYDFTLSALPRKPTDEEYALFFNSVVIGGGR